MITEVKIFDSEEFRNTLVEKEKTKNKIEKNLIYQKKSGIEEAFFKVKSELEFKKKAWENRTCESCGGNMRFIGGYDFWGCENYNDGNNHTTHGEKYYDEPFDFGFNWLLSIKKLAKINVKISNIYKFLLENQYNDIRLDVIGEKTIIPDFTEVQKRAKDQEDEFYMKTKNAFDKITPQFGMKITNSETNRPKKRIADFIASNETSVFYIEIKNSISDFNEAQFHETFEGIEYLMKSTSNNKRLFGCVYYFKEKLFDINEKSIISNLIETSIREGGTDD